MRQIRGLIWHDKSWVASQGLSLWARAKGSLLLLPPRTVTHKLQSDSCAIFFHIAVHWCRGIPDAVSCPFQQGCYHLISCLHSSLVGGGGGEGISFYQQWEEKSLDPLSSIASKNPNAQRGPISHFSPQEQGYSSHQLWHPQTKLYVIPPCHECPPAHPSQTLPYHVFALGMKSRSCSAKSKPSPPAASQHDPQGCHTRPASKPLLQGSLWVAKCSHAPHLLSVPILLLSTDQGQQ